MENFVERLFDMGILSTSSYRSFCSLLSLVSSLYTSTRAAVFSDLESADPLNLVLSLSLLQDWAIMKCPQALLPRVCHSMIALEVACYALARCDDPIGETVETGRERLQSLSASKFLRDAHVTSSAPLDLPLGLNRPTLHRNWQAQDGLLLPTRRSIFNSVEFCYRVNSESKDLPCLDLFRLVSEQGAHYLALKLLCTTSMMWYCDLEQVVDMETAISQTVSALADRSLGGIGSGITSAIVDSLWAVVFFPLPTNDTSSFGACPPRSIHTRNYERVLVLTNVGATASTTRRSLELIVSTMLSIG